MAFLYQILWLLFFRLISAQQTSAVANIGPKGIPVAQQTYNWNPEYRCRLLAHGSVVLKNDDHYVLVFDSGMAKYKFNWEGKPVEILDLNGWTVTVDLSKRFNTQDFGLVSETKKAINVPVLNRFGIWADSNQDSIYIQGGHFYTAPGWNESEYNIKGGDIPPYSIWRFDLSSQQWTDITERGGKKDKFRRALGGAGVSVTSMNQSFYIGGYVTARSDPNAPLDLMTPQGGMLVYDHDNGNLYNETYGTDEEQGYGFWHGSLNHMKLGPGKGFLISLMGEKGISGVTRPDAPEVNDETGIPVSFDSVLFYDLDKNKWYKQKTTFIDDDEPITRTRFCGKTVYSNTTNTWELWVYGGQLVDMKGEGVDDIYVLSMPSFIWTKLKIAQGEYHIRSHSCHAIGSQLVVVGGYPPGFEVEPDVECATELIRVFDMNTIAWKSYYDPGTVYSTPQDIIDHAELNTEERRVPYLKPWADPALEAAFNWTPPSPPPATSSGTKLAPQTDSNDSSFPSWKIAVIVIGSIAGLLLVAGIVFFIISLTKGSEGTREHVDIPELAAK